MAEQPAIRQEDGGSTPAPSLQDLWVDVCSTREASDFVKLHHYTHETKGTTPKYTYKVLDKRTGRIVGAAIFGIPGQLQTLQKYGTEGLGEKIELVELRRLVLLDECPKNSESTVLSVLFRLLRTAGVQRILSYSDPNEIRENHPDGKHTGLIYRATGFHKVKEAGKTKAIWWKGQRYPIRNVDQYNNLHADPGDAKRFLYEGRLWSWDELPEKKKIKRREKCPKTKANPEGFRWVWVPKIPSEYIGINKVLRAALDRGDAFWSGQEYLRTFLKPNDLKSIADTFNHAEKIPEAGKIGYVKDLKKGMPYFETPTPNKDTAEWSIRPSKI